MGLNPYTFRIVARIIAMGYAIPSLIIFPVILAFGNHPWANSDYLFAAIGFISIIGLFIGLKWQGLGGLISALFPLWVIIGQVRMLLEHKPEFGSPNIILIISLLLCIPCIIYGISWFLSKPQKLYRHHKKSDAPLNKDDA